MSHYTLPHVGLTHPWEAIQWLRSACTDVFFHASAMETCLKSLQDYRACARRVHLTCEDRQTALLSAAESESTVKRRRAAKRQIEWWIKEKVQDGCSVQDQAVDACLHQRSDELTAAALAFKAKCDGCPCKYCAEPNPACTAQESQDCCNAYIVYRATFNSCMKNLLDIAASA